MKKETIPFRKRLSFRITVPIISTFIILGFLLFTFTLKGVAVFIQFNVNDYKSGYDLDLNYIMNNSYDDLMTLGFINDSAKIIIKKAETISQIEYYFKKNKLIGNIIENGRVIYSITSPNVSTKISGNRLINSLILPNPERFLRSEVVFEPWKWKINIVQDSSTISILAGKMKQSIIIMVLAIPLLVVILLVLLQVFIIRPIHAIISSIQDKIMPEYQGVYELEFLSNSIAEELRNRESNEKRQNILNRMLATSLQVDSIKKLLDDCLEIILNQDYFHIKNKGAIFLVKDDNSQILVMQVQRNLDSKLLQLCQEVPFGRCLCGRTALTGEIVFSDCIDERHDNRFEGIDPHGHYCVPILSSTKKLLGVFTLYTEEFCRRNQMVEEMLYSVANVLSGIIERKRVESFVVESEDKYRNLFKNSKDAIFLSTKQGQFVDVNQAMCNLLGYTREELLGINVSEIYLTPEDRKQYQQIIDDKGFVSNYEMRFVTKDGLPVYSLISSTLQKNKAGSIFGYQGIIRDITMQKQVEEEKKKLENHLRQAQKMEAIGTLAGGIAHDFNNVLGAILGFADMARDDSPDGSLIAQDLDRVLSAGDRAKELVKQILAFSRQEESECIPLQPASIVKEALKILRPSLPTTIEINQNIDSTVGLILADPTKIHQILLNLCTNAFHAMEETGGKLDILLKETYLSSEDLVHESDVEAGTFVQLSIRDSGSGIAPEIKEKIFDPYFTTKEIGKGTGMGLSIVHGIVKSSGGFISLDSELGKGTAFHVFLPVMEKEILPESDTVEEIEGGKERILFIDDEKILTEMRKDMLERLGYHVTTINSSLESLAIFKNQPDQFDIVITDQTMPDMTGADLARKMLQIRPDIPIILCTGYSSIISEVKAKSIGIKKFALKPLAKKDIAKLIRKVLDASDLSTHT